MFGNYSTDNGSINGIIDALERDGLVNLLAEPNLTALSGETASFLAGGEIPIPLAGGLGTTTIEYKQYGVSLAFTPTVLANGLLHVSEMAAHRVQDVRSEVKEGDQFLVKVLEVDRQGKIRLSRKEAMPAPTGAGSPDPSAR